MVHAWLKEFGKRWFSGKQKRPEAPRPRVRLEVESLEARLVPTLLVNVQVNGYVTPPSSISVKAGYDLPISLSVDYETQAGGDSGNGYTGPLYLTLVNSSGVVQQTGSYTITNGYENLQSTDQPLYGVTAGTYSLEWSTVGPAGTQAPYSDAQFGAPYANNNYLQVTVVHGPVAQYEFVHTATGKPFNTSVIFSWTVGDAKAITIEAMDNYGNLVPGYNKTADLRISDPYGFVLRDATNSYRLSGTTQSDGSVIVPITLSGGLASFYLDVIHSTQFANKEYFNLYASTTTATTVIQTNPALFFTASPTAYVYQVAVETYTLSNGYTETDYMETAPTLAQAESQALANYSPLADVWIDLNNTYEIRAAN